MKKMQLRYIICSQFFIILLTCVAAQRGGSRCYTCASSLQSAAIDDPFNGRCKDDSTEPCCKDPFDQSERASEESESYCEMCIKAKFTWADRDDKEIAFFRRMCYNSAGDDSINFDKLLTTAVSRGDQSSPFQTLEEAQEEREKTQEVKAAVLRGECETRKMPSPVGEVILEVCGCEDNLCNRGGGGLWPSHLLMIITCCCTTILLLVGVAR